MPKTVEQLSSELDNLEASLPDLVAAHPDPAEFWPAFAGAADEIVDAAGAHVAKVLERIQAMLAAHAQPLGYQPT